MYNILASVCKKCTPSGLFTQIILARCIAAHLPDFAISNSKKLEKLAKSLFLFRFFLCKIFPERSNGPGKSLQAYGTIKLV